MIKTTSCRNILKNKSVSPRRVFCHYGLRPLLKFDSTGFTMIESMIFFAVSGALFLTSILVISGQQANTNFRLAVTDVSSQLQDVANDVSSGFYSNTGNIGCRAPGASKPQIDPAGTAEQGAYGECIFMGRAVQFNKVPPSSANTEQFWVSTIVGRRQTRITGSTLMRDVVDYNEALPIASDQAITKNNLTNGIKLKTMKSKSASGEFDISGVAFVSTLASYKDNALESGRPTIEVIPIQGSDPVNFAYNIEELKDTSSFGVSNANPDQGIKMCFENSGGSKYAFITFGIKNSFTPETEFGEGVCP